MEHDPADDGYTGPVTVLVDDQEILAEAVLRGHHEPIDGRYRWYGRLSASPALDGVASGSVEVRTPYGSAAAKLSDCDPWGRLRIAGVGHPPFLLTTS